MEIIFIVRNKNNSKQEFQYRNGNFYHSNGKRYNPSKEKNIATMFKVLTAFRAIESSKDEKLKGMLNTLVSSENRHLIQQGYENKVNGGPLGGILELERKVDDGKSVNSSTTLDFSEKSKQEFKEVEGIEKSDLTTVIHEMTHQYDFEIGNMAVSYHKKI